MRDQSVERGGGNGPVETDDHHPPAGVGYGLDPLGPDAQDEARHPEPGCLPLGPTGVREHGRGMELEGQGRAVSLWRDDVNVITEADPARVESGRSPRMQREDNGPIG